MPSESVRKTRKAAGTTRWWQTGVIYQIYVRSFYDSNGDGVGDIPGITSKLDYIKELGVDAIWLTPVTVSANYDWGYDVVDYYNIQPELGTMDDFDELIKQAHRRDIKVLFDFVPNHTSVQHPWFQDALTGKDAKYRDYYMWADPKPGGGVPNNWVSWFGGSCWKYDKASGQYFLHNWFDTQADLNWRNPSVRAEFDKIMKFWYDRGVDGFRIDVFNMLIKDAQLRDNPKSQHDDSIELRLLGQRPTYTTAQPEVHDILKHWREIADSYPQPKLLLGETTLTYNARKVAEFYGAGDELELAFNFNYLRSRFEAEGLRDVIEDVEMAIKEPDWPVWANSNHDEQSRFSTRWAHGDERKIRMGMMILLTLRGTPVMYYGDEIGLQNVYIAPWRLKDPIGKRFWPVFGGRDRGRTPMPWKHAKGAGFTPENVRPWLPYAELKGRNVAEQTQQQDTTWRFTHDLLALRKSSVDLELGVYHSISSPVDTWMWHRGHNTVVALNMSDRAHTMDLPAEGTLVLGTNRQRDGAKVARKLELEPWEGVIVQTVE